MYFKTLRTSETGKKFTAIIEKISVTNQASKEFAKKYDVKAWRPDGFAAFGGIATVMLNNPPDKKLWKLRKGKTDEYVPNYKTNEGKIVEKELTGVPVVSRHELNMCIGFEADFKSIGFNNSDKYFGYTTNDEWNVPVPDDCTEITRTEYLKLFGKEDKQ